MTVERIYWDSDAFLGWFQEEAGKVELCKGTIKRAQDVVWNNNIKPKDAIHVATAINLKIGVLETFDGHLLGQTGTIGSPSLVIRKPIAPKQADLGL